METCTLHTGQASLEDPAADMLHVRSTTVVEPTHERPGAQAKFFVECGSSCPLPIQRRWKRKNTYWPLAVSQYHALENSQHTHVYSCKAADDQRHSPPSSWISAPNSLFAVAMMCLPVLEFFSSGAIFFKISKISFRSGPRLCSIMRCTM